MIRFLKVIFVLAAIGAMSVFGVRAAAVSPSEIPSAAADAENISITFYNGDEPYCEEVIKQGEAPTLPAPPEREGYAFEGWCFNSAKGEKYESGEPLNADTVLYAAYELTPPSFEISSLSFTYDGGAHSLKFADISHPLLDEGFISYEWYKDGEAINCFGESVSVREVRDSGSYVCRLTFSVEGDVARLSTLPVSVEISKCPVPIPEIPEASYTADPIFPQIFDTGAYSVVRKSYVDAGEHPIEITLKDPDNYAFSGTDDTTVSVAFVISRAQNYWIDQPYISDGYTEVPTSPTASARFGEVGFLYSPVGKEEYTSTQPTKAGEYLMCAIVEETENYTALISSPVKFRILEEKITGISVKTPADRLEYVAFDSFDPTGIEVSVSYNSGRGETVGAEELTFSYLRGECFLYGDKGIRVSYCGASVILDTEILRADYDITDVSFTDFSQTYSGEHIGAEYTGALPTGLDGISLMAAVSGGGVNAGKYELVLEFSTSSPNYNTPSPITATLTILPLAREVEWSELSFTYDGTAKLPRAFFVDVFGERAELAVSGTRINAGTYTATAASDDENYVFSGLETSYEILKADYDVSGAEWIGGGVIYNGEEHEVYLSGLPDGVTVNGYVNNKATDAGEYMARAVFLYDRLNYNEPDIADYEWEILKATYSGEGISFADNTVTYDGEAHYPLCNGEMPTGKDGIALEYSFSEGVTHVADAPVAVTVTFTTKSKNYIAPDPITCYVKILPRVVAVEWILSDFCYTGAPQFPIAVSDECEISVMGAGVSAGEHTVYAVPKTNDFTISNPTCTYTIAKAENGWREGLSVESVFFGQAVKPIATALGGEVEYVYYSDPECKVPLSTQPSAVGVYYIIAHTDGNGNYLSVTSEPVSFEIIAIVPVALEITILNGELRAFDSPSFAAALLNNDGTRTPIFSSDISVSYQRGDSLLFGDTEIIFGYSDFTATVSVSVLKQCYDMSGIQWIETSQVYDGTPKSPKLSGLPDGVTVKEYVGADKTEVGEYVVSAVLSYDSENYIAPVCASVRFTVKKQVVSLPQIPVQTYNGTALLPFIEDSPLYTSGEFAAEALAGSYPVVFTLTDSKNYAFAGGESSVSVPFIIAPRDIEITVSDVEQRLFDNDIAPSFSVTGGSLVPGDSLTPSYRVDGNKIYADFSNTNYKVTVIPGEVKNGGIFSSGNIDYLMLILFVFFGVLLIVAVLLYTNRGSRYVLRVHETGSRQRRYAPTAEEAPPPVAVTEEPAADASAASENISEPTDNGECAPVIAEPDGAEHEGVSTQRADELITDGLARDLIRRDDDVVTGGHRHGIINIDTLSRSFSAGERVDINALKSHSLIPYDTAYIKVLARGILDKPLDVYANDFSLCAVKMIALMGGKAIKVNTVSAGKRGKKR
ncbi:MAG: uL15 family ribosomal protein [Clostridia bacterium]|nr:uL15 family ribosomal protein [Clostridia bacterium]